MTMISLAPPMAPIRPATRRAGTTAPAGFGGATRVRTLMGLQQVDRLMAGDLVLDKDGHVHELRAVRQVRTQGDAVVRIGRKGRAPLTVGAGQRLIADDWRAQVVLGGDAVCVAARMVDGCAIRRGQPRRATLYQLSFDQPVCLDVDGAQAVVTPLG